MQLLLSAGSRGGVTAREPLPKDVAGSEGRLKRLSDGKEANLIKSIRPWKQGVEPGKRPRRGACQFSVYEMT